MDTRVLIFDDNKDRRDSLELLIQSTSGLSLAGVCSDAINAVKSVEKYKPDVILMDIGMPQVTGIEATRLIKEKFPDVQVIIQTVFEDNDRIFDALKSGASGYLLKSSSVDKITEAIFDSVNGGAPISPSIATKVISFFRDHAKANDNEYMLSEREKEVLSFLVDGLSYKMIAAKLNISYFTVNSHIRKIYEKLHVHSIGEAISKAIRQGIVGK